MNFVITNFAITILANTNFVIMIFEITNFAVTNLLMTNFVLKNFVMTNFVIGKPFTLQIKYLCFKNEIKYTQGVKSCFPQKL